MKWVACVALAFLVPLLAGCLVSPGSDGPGSGTGSSSASKSASKSATRTTTKAPSVHPSGGGTAGNGTGAVANGTANVTGPPREWALPEAAAIRPGASINGGECTANFVFTSPDNSTVYLGTAAHCFSDGAATDTDGCVAPLQKLGVKRDLQGASKPVTLAYSSWSAMQAHKESGELCTNNDFALMQLDPADYDKVSPALRKFGGPTGLASAKDLNAMDRILSYGNSGTRPEDSALSPREGYVTLAAGGCDARVVFPNAAIPGDSGSPVLLADGRAIGDFVSIELTPVPGQGHVCVLDGMLEYARSVGMDVRLATWDLLDDGMLPP